MLGAIGQIVRTAAVAVTGHERHRDRGAAQAFRPQPRAERALVLLTALGLTLALAGAAGFRRRDLTIEAKGP
ncbi:hypothetical protein ACFPZ0_28485, partial [Streptomonospora nanhaiensis]|uniref:hypothetical protein n=1 Tax=Streptomonospora nanhaiensis TaxID=1323731 RepID=UPI00361931AD